MVARASPSRRAGKSTNVRISRAHRQQRIQREIARIKALCEGIVDAEGRVSLVDAVKIVMREKLRDYNRGYTAGSYRERRRVA